jgi:hypothetical protein
MVGILGQSSDISKDVDGKVLPEIKATMKLNRDLPNRQPRKRVVVVGLGMVGIAFMSVIIKIETN